MKYYVNGGNKFQRHVAEKTSEYMCKKLKLTRYPSLEVLVSLKNLGGQFNGLCYVTEATDVLYKARDLTVEIDNKLPLFDFIRTICHEFIHVKQYVVGEIYENLQTGKARWKKSSVPVDTPYMDQPWEKEAFKYETEYAFEVLSSIQISMKGDY